MDEIKEWDNPNEIVINYGVYFYQNDGQRQEFYIFDMKSFENQIPKTFHTLLMPLSHHFEDYENSIMDDESKIGIYLRDSEMIDDGDYDWEENYCPDYKEFVKWHRIQYDPIRGKRFVLNHVFSMDVGKLFERLNGEYEKMVPRDRRTKKQQKEFERLSQNINTLMQDWYTDEIGIHNPVELLMNKCLLTEDEKKLMEVQEMEKTYVFTAKILNSCKGCVSAKSLDEAKEKIMSGDYEDIFDEYDGSIVEVVSIEEN